MSLDKIPIRTRLGCAFLDFWATCFILGILTAVIKIIFDLISGDSFREKTFDLASVYAGAFFILYKDIFNGQSFIKSFLGLQVVDIKTGNAASDFKCFIRNITAPFWLIEVVVLLFSPARRIGDLIAGTSVISVEKRSLQQWLGNVKSKKFSASTLLALICGVLYITFIWYLIHGLT